MIPQSENPKIPQKAVRTNSAKLQDTKLTWKKNQLCFCVLTMKKTKREIKKMIPYIV